MSGFPIWHSEVSCSSELAARSPQWPSEGQACLFEACVNTALQSPAALDFVHRPHGAWW